MALLKNLLAEARNKNRKKARSRTNHTYYKRRKSHEIEIEAVGSDASIEAFIQEINHLPVDRSVRLEVGR